MKRPAEPQEPLTLQSNKSTLTLQFQDLVRHSYFKHETRNACTLSSHLHCLKTHQTLKSSKLNLVIRKCGYLSNSDRPGLRLADVIPHSTWRDAPALIG